MITNEKHFTKCETPNSSKIVEDKKYINTTTNKMTNGVITETNKVKTQNEVKEMKIDENKVSSTTESKAINGSVTDEKSDTDDPNNQFGAPKYGTVIPNRIFVGGFSAKTGDEDLWRFFSSFCHITAAKIIYDRAGVSKCYGFVTFANPKDAKTIVKQHAGVMHSPMGGLRIAQAVRKQMPMFSVDMDGAVPPPGGTHYYHPLQPPFQHKAPSVCIPITSYIPITQNHMPKYPPHPPPTQSVSPHDSSSVTPESTTGVMIQQAPHSHPPAHPTQSNMMPNHNNNNINSNNGGGPGKLIGVRYAGPMVSGQQQRPPSVPVPPPPTVSAAPPLYATPQAAGMMPQYVIPAVAYPQTVPAYDATGLYTTCPGYAAYPSYVMMAPPSYPHPAAAPPMGAMLPAYHPAQPPIMNSYIY